ncbi:hypothetical protein C8R44DRAFT_730245 [Mycena epipterygia]|nr:hypothetical protein C8R44DRAFT_730245 [Mycena epipterygia]
MARHSKRQRLGHRLHDIDSSPGSDDENTPPEPPELHTPAPKSQRTTLRTQIIEKDAEITALEANISALRVLDYESLRVTPESSKLQACWLVRISHQVDLIQQERTHEKSIEALGVDYNKLLSRNQILSLTNKSLNTLKRKAESTLTEELAKKHKRIKRLEHDRQCKQEKKETKISTLRDTITTQSHRISQLELDLALSTSHINSRDAIIITLQSSIREKQTSLTAIRKRLCAAQKQTNRAKTSLKEIQKAYRDLKTWNPTEEGQYTAASRELARDLTYAGCSAGKVEFVVKSCARTFGIKIRRRFMSPRTVGRAIDEGGKYGEIQLGREIMEAPGFVESSDGTTHHGVTVESRHITLLVPSYAPGVDDSDISTWKHQTRFVEVAPALDHTGQRQFEAAVALQRKINGSWTKNDYWRKKMGECKDHAADGKKEFKFSAAHKKEIIIQDLGRASMDEADVDTGLILLTVLGSGKDLGSRTSGPASCAAFLEHKIGEEKFNTLTPAQQSNSCTHAFGGCCCHRDLNVVGYGYDSVQNVYSTHPNIPPPVLLANKAHTATINLSEDPSSAALQNAIDSSSAGAIKLLQLIGALLRHKDGERGYQDRCAFFMQERKMELYNLDEPRKFPDVSNVRYGCYTYAAAEVVCFHGLIQELVTEIIDGKTKSGQPNHVEHNILKGLNCVATMTEMVALSLYGVSVSWPYMAMVRGTKEQPINLLSLTDLHRKLPVFCAYISANPHILLDPTTPPEKLTILMISYSLQFGNSFGNFLIMFSGCETGWIQFTPEFQVGGTFDCLTPEQRAILFIPSTNDANEGMLGSYRVHMRYHPNSTARSFSNQTRTERNNTEAFIKKFCDNVVLKWVMREVRKDGASATRAKFRKACANFQREKAQNALKRRNKTASRKKATELRLAAANLEFDIAKIESMSSPLLKDQLHVYRDILKDNILLKKLWKEMGTVAVRRNLVLEARERELARRALIGPQPQERVTGTPPPVIVDEYGYSLGEDEEWEDI